ncbi:MAG TPA: thioesterase domain-containing protein [Candidatus Angelobacter sp.]
MATNASSTPFSRPLDPSSSLRLFCFPYAGGNSTFYRGWGEEMPEAVEVCPIQLAGRGHRLGEPLMTNADAIVESLAPKLLPYLDRPFAFFGHSMGALISFELTRFLRRKYNLEPVHLFISAWRSPEVVELKREYDLPHDEFVAMLRRLNGTPEEILENPEALAFLLPIIRADFQVCQTYIHRKEPPLSCPITAFGGMKDPGTALSAIRLWKHQTTGVFSMNVLPGDHFFILQYREQLISLVARSLAGVVGGLMQPHRLLTLRPLLTE